MTTLYICGVYSSQGLCACSGTAAASPAASKGDAAAVANLTHHDMPAPPSTPKTPVAAGNHSSDRASTLRAAQQQEEGTQAAGWAMFRAHGLHMDQSMLAQAHAAMLTIEMEGVCLQPLPAQLKHTVCTALARLSRLPGGCHKPFVGQPFVGLDMSPISCTRPLDRVRGTGVWGWCKNFCGVHGISHAAES